MNAWFTRLLAGAACTAGALALSAGAAQADDHHGHGLDLGIVKIATHSDHQSSSHHSSSSSGSSSGSGGSHHSGGLKVSLHTPLRADVNLSPRHTSVHVGTTTSSSSSSSRRSNLATVRIGTGSSHHASGGASNHTSVQVHTDAVRAHQAQQAKAAKARRPRRPRR